MEMDKLGMITQRTTEISSGGESVSQASLYCPCHRSEQDFISTGPCHWPSKTAKTSL